MQTVYHGTTLDQAVKIMQGDFKKDPVKSSLGYSFNVTDSLEEAKTHATVNAWKDSQEKGAIIEFILTPKNLHISQTLHADESIYALAKKDNYDVIDIDLSKKSPLGFHVFCIYDHSTLSNSKITQIIPL